MKRKLVLILLTGLLLTGCAADKVEDDSVAGTSRTQVEQAEAGTESTKEDADNAGGSENTGDSENADSANQEGASDNAKTEEAYILTFEAATMEGEVITSECFADSKLTMLNVWATYCGPCLNEMPDLGEIATSYDKSDFQMMGIISDVVAEDAEGMEYAAELITQTGANYPHIPLNQSLYSNLVGGVDSVPTTFFVNQKGEVLGYVLGAQSKDTWEEIINSLLAEIE